MGDVVSPDDPADAVTPISEYDRLSSAASRLWSAGLAGDDG
jgi:hypothetical protein